MNTNYQQHKSHLLLLSSYTRQLRFKWLGRSHHLHHKQCSPNIPMLQHRRPLCLLQHIQQLRLSHNPTILHHLIRRDLVAYFQRRCILYSEQLLQNLVPTAKCHFARPRRRCRKTLRGIQRTRLSPNWLFEYNGLSDLGLDLPELGKW